MTLSIRTRSLPWRIWSCENPHVKSFNVFGSCGRIWSNGRRFASVSRAGDEKKGKETFVVRCGSSGGIGVDIYNSEALSNPNIPLIIYFPPTGVHERDRHPPIPTFLSNLPFATALAQVNYRWNIPAPKSSSLKSQSLTPLSSAVGYNIHPFPTPLHDTLFAYDFLTKTFLPSIITSNSNDISQKQKQRPILLAGTFLGGTLATSLALTSTYASLQNPFRIVGVLTMDAVFDWSGVAVSKDLSSTKSPTCDDKNEDGGGWNVEKLHAFKKKLFSNPAGAFDPFASPMLFFRTAGWSIPKHWVGERPSHEQGEVNRYSTSIDAEEEVSCSYGEIPGSATSEKILQGEKEDLDLGPEISRVSYLKFPPTVSPTTSNSMSRYRDSRGTRKMQQLVVPRGLFLYSKDRSMGEIVAGEGGVKGKRKGRDGRGGKMKGKSSVLVEEISSEGQAKDMARVMRRSVLLVEFKDRAVWDEGFDASGEAQRRVGVLAVDDGDDDEGEEGLDGKVGEWIEDCLE